MIPEEAIEAAARTIYEAEPRREDGWYAPWEPDEHGVLSEGGKEERRVIARAVLATAGPLLAAQALDEAADEFDNRFDEMSEKMDELASDIRAITKFGNYQAELAHVVVTLRSRAAAIRDPS